MPPGIGYGNRRRRTARPSFSPLGMLRGAAPHLDQPTMPGAAVQGAFGSPQGGVLGNLVPENAKSSRPPALGVGSLPYGAHTGWDPDRGYFNTGPLTPEQQQRLSDQGFVRHGDSWSRAAANRSQQVGSTAPGVLGMVAGALPSMVAMNQGYYSTEGTGVRTGMRPETRMDMGLALAGELPMAPPNAESPLLGPQLSLGAPRPQRPTLQQEIQSGALQERLPEGTTYGGGSTVAYREDGRPVLLPPRLSAEQYFGGDVVPGLTAEQSRERTAARRAGDRGLAFRGSYALSDDNRNVSQQELGRRRQEVVDRNRTARERTLPGFPQLPGRMSDAQVQQSMDQRRRSRGVPALGGGATTGGGRGTFDPGRATNRPLSERHASLEQSSVHPSVGIALGDIDPFAAGVDDVVSGFATASGNFSEQDSEAYRQYIQDRYAADEDFRDEMDAWLGRESWAINPGDEEMESLMESANVIRDWFGKKPLRREFLNFPGTSGGY